LKTLNYGSGATFDVRQTGLGGMLAKQAGVNLQSAKIFGLGSKEGGFRGVQERKAKKVKEESELYKTTMSTDKEVEQWSNVRQAEYEAEKKKAAAAAGTTFDGAKYDREHPAPKTYTSVEGLNNDRMATFQDKIGKTGLLYTMAESFVKGGSLLTLGLKPFEVSADELAKAIKEYNIEAAKDPVFKAKNPNAPTKESLTEERIGNWKLGLGIAGAGIAGGMVGGVVGLPISGVAVGEAAALRTQLTDKAAWGKARTGMDKDRKKLEEIERRLVVQTDKLESQTVTLANAAQEESSKPVDKRLVTARAGVTDLDKQVYDINNAGLESAIIESTVAQKEYEGQLQALSQKMASQGGKYTSNDESRENEIREGLKNTITELNRLNTIKSTHNDINNTRTQIYNLKGDKSKAKEASAGGGKPHAPSSPAPETPHAPTSPSSSTPPGTGGSTSHP